MFFMGASPLISLIGNSKVVIVASILLLFLLSPIGNSPDSCSGEYPSKDCLGKCFVDKDSYDNCSDCSGVCCFTSLPKFGYWKVK